MQSNQHIKVDITSVDATDGSYLLLLNFNLPKTVVEDNVPVSKVQVLNDIVTYLEKHFSNLNIYYQVTASYNLTNKETGDKRLFTGSFCPSSANQASLSGPVFVTYSRDNFSVQVQSFTTEENILNCLQWPSGGGGDDNSDWEFSDLVSVIINCQVLVQSSHLFLKEQSLLVSRNKRHGRRRVTSFHPW